MTIYKPSNTEKKPVDDKSSVSYEKLDSPYVIRVAGTGSDVLGRREEERRRRRVFRIFSIFLFIVVLIIAIFTMLYVYKKLIHKPFISVCPVRYHEGRMRGSFDEMVEVDAGRYGYGGHDGYARLQVPSFIDSHASLVVHDFSSNKSAIVDADRARCFVMPMDTKYIQPPSSIIDLLDKLRRGDYMPDMEIIRETYVVVEPEIADIQQLGHRIGHECQLFTTHYIRKDSKGVVKRSTCTMAVENFCLGMTSEKFIKCVKLTSCV